MRTETLRVRGLCKTEDGKKVLEEVNFHIFAGEMVGIIGLQRSGKGTLVDILCGLAQADEGEILIEDKEIGYSDMSGAMHSGIYRIVEHIEIIPAMTVSEYLFASSRYYWRSEKKHNLIAREILHSFKVEIDPSKRMASLTISQQRIIEFIRVILQRPKLIILDNVRDIGFQNEELAWRITKKAQHMGISFLVIGNRAHQLMLRCNRVYPLFAGTLGRPIEQERLNREILFKAITGEEFLQNNEEHTHGTIGQEVVIEAREFCGNDGQAYSFKIHEGEISAMIIPEKEQAVHFAAMLTGDMTYSGQLLLRGEQVHFQNVADAIQAGVCFITDDVRRWGIFPGLSITENMTLLSRNRRYRPVEYISGKSEEYLAKRLAEEVELQSVSLKNTPQKEKLTFSDMQKVVLARYLPLHPKVYVFLNPLQSNDEVSAEGLIHLIQKLAQRGAAILIIATGTERLRSFCDNIRFFA